MKNYQNKSEDYFLSLLEKDKVHAFHYAFDTFWLILYKQAKTKVKCPIIAKDLVQDVFIVLWSKIDSLDEKNRILAFLFATLRNKMLHFFEKEKVRLRYILRLQADLNSSETNPEQFIIAKELGQLIKSQINNLPMRMQKIYHLKREEGLTIREIASNLSLSEQTVRNQLSFAYTRIRSGLKDYQSV